MIEREQFAPRISAQILKNLSQLATPGPWDAFGSHVSAVAVPASEPDGGIGRSDPESHEYYGGELICESCYSPDANLIAAMRNMLPSLVDAHLALIKDLANAQRELRVARAETVEQRELVELIRSSRYAQLQYPPAHVLGIRYAPSRLWGEAALR